MDDIKAKLTLTGTAFILFFDTIYDLGLFQKEVRLVLCVLLILLSVLSMIPFSNFISKGEMEK